MIITNAPIATLPMGRLITKLGVFFDFLFTGAIVSEIGPICKDGRV
jgi:hypothetical protein